MSFLKRLRDELKSDLRELAIDAGEEFREELIRDGIRFTSGIGDDLTRWGSQYASGELTGEDLEWLIAAKRDLAEMKYLKLKGLKQIQIERLKNALVATVAGSLIKAVRP
ncbi:MAG: hypothetical protein JJU46_12490 [Balneolaceae bacterium]|nr:hypothetical protein [Balneolaceae bacterium]MCH8547612.1 hypothetical protein [Balneolaceae bacterium]